MALARPPMRWRTCCRKCSMTTSVFLDGLVLGSGGEGEEAGWRYGLAGEGVFQFGGGDGESVEAEQDVDGLLMLQAEMNLARDGETVLFVKLGGFGVHAAGWGEVGEMEGLSEKIRIRGGARREFRAIPERGR